MLFRGTAVIAADFRFDTLLRYAVQVAITM